MRKGCEFSSGNSSGHNLRHPNDNKCKSRIRQTEMEGRLAALARKSCSSIDNQVSLNIIIVLF